MPTVFSHPAPFVCLGLACGRLLSARLLLAGIICSLLPDADALAFRFNIPYASILGHRGLSHSLAFALALGLAAALIAPLLRSGRKTAFVVCAGAALSHILLDAMTDGGLGVAAFAGVGPGGLGDSGQHQPGLAGPAVCADAPHQPP